MHEMQAIVKCMNELRSLLPTVPLAEYQALLLQTLTRSSGPAITIGM
jgi:hypothetical protein